MTLKNKIKNDVKLYCNNFCTNYFSMESSTMSTKKIVKANNVIFRGKGKDTISFKIIVNETGDKTSVSFITESSSDENREEDILSCIFNVESLDSDMLDTHPMIRYLSSKEAFEAEFWPNALSEADSQVCEPLFDRIKAKLEEIDA